MPSNLVDFNNAIYFRASFTSSHVNISIRIEFILAMTFFSTQLVPFFVSWVEGWEVWNIFKKYSWKKSSIFSGGETTTFWVSPIDRKKLCFFYLYQSYLALCFYLKSYCSSQWPISFFKRLMVAISELIWFCSWFNLDGFASNSCWVSHNFLTLHLIKSLLYIASFDWTITQQLGANTCFCQACWMVCSSFSFKTYFASNQKTLLLEF